MSYALKVIKDNPIMFLPLDETSGSVAYDISGCGNDGTHSDGIVSGLLPLIPGGATGTTITNTKYVDCSLINNYYGQEQVVSFGQEGFSDNDFSMEIWIYPKFNNSENLIFGDQVNDVGIFWEKGNVVFKLNSEILEYTVPYYKKALHIVAVYSVNMMIIYLDGIAVASKTINRFKFSNSYLNISVGPTTSGSSFIVDAPAIYRYSLSSNQVQNHYVAGQQQVMPVHIATPEGGYLYPLSDENTKEISFTTFPITKSFDQMVVDGLSYDKVTNSLYLTPTDSASTASVEIKEQISVPSSHDFVRSKISWAGDNGISVYSSIDDDTYVLCTNGEQIPQYENGVGDSNGLLYIKIIFDSNDTSRFNPELSRLDVSFYDTNNIYGNNNPYYAEPDTDSSYTLGSVNYPILSRDYRNGLRVNPGNSFKINANIDVKTVEFFYTRNALDNGGLVSSGTSTFTWGSTGDITKNNILSFFVNKQDMTSQTNVSGIFLSGEPYHVVLVFDQAIDAGEDIVFNPGSTGASASYLYKNISIYGQGLDSTDVQNHYNIYAGRPLISTSDTSITVSEQAPLVHDNDWVVIKSI